MAPTVCGYGLHEPPPVKINYRAVGRGSGGVFKKRIPVYIKGVDRPSPPTMPTKYETILLDENREKKGFDSYTPRFTEARSNEVPGPGAYAEETEVGVDFPDGPMSSRPATPRGKGVFASRTPRIPLGAGGIGAGGNGFVAPGPGTYELDNAESTSAPTPASADFALPGAGNPANYDRRPSPGPGAFLGPWGAVPPLGWSAPAHSFTCAKRPGFKSAGDTPGPGEYSNLMQDKVHASSPSHKKSSIKKLCLAHETSDAARLKKGAEIVKTGSDEQRTSNEVPGPGMYSPRSEAVKGQSQFGTKGHSSFQIGNSHMPRSWNFSDPGPGYYDAQEPQPKVSAPSSTMKSHTSRFKTDKPAAPGPAYYSPKKGSRQSYHLNFQNNWL